MCLLRGEEDAAKGKESPKGQPQEGGSSPSGEARATRSAR